MCVCDGEQALAVTIFLSSLISNCKPPKTLELMDLGCLVSFNLFHRTTNMDPDSRHYVLGGLDTADADYLKWNYRLLSA